MTFVLSVLVGMLSHPTLLLFLKCLMIFSVSKMDVTFHENCLTLKFYHQGNFRMRLRYY